MWVKRGFTDNFRNLRRKDVELHPNLNILVGSNGQGKTNFLEAIFLLAAGSSPRTGIDQELISWGEEYFFVKGEVYKRDDLQRISLGYSTGKKKIRVDETVSPVRELLGNLLVVFFSPEDLQLIKGSPAARRRFLNREISFLYPLYYDSLQQLGYILQQRNNLLKGYSPQAEEQLEIWDEQFCQQAATVIIKRLEVTEEIEPLAAQFYNAIASEDNQLSVRYRPPIPLKSTSLKDWEQGLSQALKRRRKEEIKRGMTLLGPQRDDLEIMLDRRELKIYGSQGQQRTAVLALKMAELEYIRKKTGQQPVLLLDDVFSELDIKRQRALVQLIQEDNQTIITTTDLNFREDSIPSYCFQVEKGEILFKEGRD